MLINQLLASDQSEDNGEEETRFRQAFLCRAVAALLLLLRKNTSKVKMKDIQTSMDFLSLLVRYVIQVY